jgi:phasin family protein
MSKSTSTSAASATFESNGKQRAATGTPSWDAQATFADLAGASRENFDAFVKASTVFAQGFGAIGQQWVEFARTTLEQGVEATRAVISSKNVKDALEVQTNFARAAFDRYLNEAGKISELGVKTTTDAFAPIQKRVDEVVAKYNRAA